MRIVSHNGAIQFEGKDGLSNCDFHMDGDKPMFHSPVKSNDVVQLFETAEEWIEEKTMERRSSPERHMKWVVRPSDQFKKRWVIQNPVYEPAWEDRKFLANLPRLDMESGDAVLVEEQ